MNELALLFIGFWIMILIGIHLFIPWNFYPWNKNKEVNE